MSILTYRGQEYPQQKAAASKDFKSLTYSNSSYKKRQKEAEAKVSEVLLTYRGLNYIQHKAIKVKKRSELIYRTIAYSR